MPPSGNMQADDPDDSDVSTSLAAGAYRSPRPEGYQDRATGCRAVLPIDGNGSIGRPRRPASLKWEPCSKKYATPPTAKRVTSFCPAHHMKIVREIPYDVGLADAERAGQPALDYGPHLRALTQYPGSADLMTGASLQRSLPTTASVF